MEGVCPGIPAFPVDATDYCHIYVVGRHIYVGGFRNFRKFLMDQRRYFNGRLRIDDRIDHRFSVVVQDTFQISYPQHPAGFGHSIHRLRLCVYGMSISPAGYTHVLYKRVFQDPKYICLLEQPATAHHT